MGKRPEKKSQKNSGGLPNRYCGQTGGPTPRSSSDCEGTGRCEAIFVDAHRVFAQLRTLGLIGSYQCTHRIQPTSAFLETGGEKQGEPLAVLRRERLDLAHELVEIGFI